MGTLVALIAGNVIALIAAMLFKLSVTEVYAFLAFNFTGLLFIGFINLVAFVRKNVKEVNDDTTRIASDS